jgi:Effector Associated Constant Component 1
VGESPFIIEFPGVSIADANRYAADLAASLRQVDERLTVRPQRDRPDTQDGGATLAIILGTASVTALAKGLSAWLARHTGAKIQINVDGSVIASNLDSRDAARIAKAFRPGS